MKISSIFLSMILLALIPFGTLAAIIHVPTDQPTIQAGIDAAVDGDTVLVADGTYTGDGNRDIDFKGKAITVTSENGASSCIIDCENRGRGFIFQNWESPISILNGLTITHGSAIAGGGIYIINSSPTISDCTISSNEARGYASGPAPIGGGIYCIDACPVLVNCKILANFAYAFDYWYTVGGAEGGGIYCRSSSLTLVNCLVSSNSVVCGIGGSGGGICSSDSSIYMENSQILENTVISIWISLAGVLGAGINIHRGSSTVFVNSIISNNRLDGQSLCVGSGVCVIDHNDIMLIANSIISGNSATEEVDQRQGICFTSNNKGFLLIINSIIYNNDKEQIAADNYLIEFSDVEGMHYGIGNIAEEPCFIGGDPFDYHVSPDSPCIDAGTDLGTLPTDIEGNPRLQGGAVDMGAYEFSGWPSITRAYIKMPSHNFKEGDTTFCAASVWNPFEYSLDHHKLFVLLDIFDQIFMAPSFSEFDYYTWSFDPGKTDLVVLPEFSWPYNAGSTTDVVWYAFLTNPEMTALASEIGVFDFGWGE